MSWIEKAVRILVVIAMFAVAGVIAYDAYTMRQDRINKRGVWATSYDPR